MKTLRCWFRTVLTLVFGMICLVAGVNLVIDPFGIYRLVSVDGINANKHSAISHIRLVKPYLVDKLNPVTLVMGSSRPEIAIDPDYTAWPESYRPVYNYSFHGTTIQELAGWLDHALQVAPVRHLVLGLDFHLFASREKVEQLWEGALPLHRKALLSLDGLIASWRTLRQQDPIDDPGLLANGQVAWTANLRRVRKHGHRRDFINNEETFLRSRHDRKAGRRGYVKPQSIEVLRQMLELCRQRNVTVTLFVMPVHVRYVEVFYQSGVYDEYLDWQQTLTTLVAANNRDFPDQPEYTLFNFSGVNPVNTETVPPLGDVETDMTYYWESSHCKKATGDLILDFIFDHREKLPFSDFGAQLTPENVALEMTRAKTRFEDYRSQHPDMVEEISSLRSGLDEHQTGL